jgi:2-methylcitrate dehydratase PrpD
MDIIERLAKNVFETKYEHLPEDAIEITKLAILDTIGCMIAGARAPGCDSLRKRVQGWGGRTESTIMVYGDKVPCPNAAFVNSTMARALDFDSTWERGMHMSAASVPVALAVSETCKDVSGKDLLTAIIAGEDLAARVHLATSDYDGFEPTGVCGILGLAVITGKILGFEESEMLDSLAIALNRAAGSFQPNIEGALIIRVMEGFAARSGIESALLAQNGITGGKNVLQGRYAYFHLFSHDRFNGEILTDKLGKEFLGALETTFKKYPACGGTATAVEATLELVSENNIRPEHVEEITVDSNRFFNNISGGPFKIGANPQANAQFSYRYAVANALVRRRFTIQDITPAAIRSPEILQVVEKVHPMVNDDLEKQSFRATIVCIRTKDGRRYSKQKNYPKGSKQNPMGKEEIIEKFLSNVGLRESPLSKRIFEQIIHLVDKLERVSHIGELIRMLIVD